MNEMEAKAQVRDKENLQDIGHQILNESFFQEVEASIPKALTRQDAVNRAIQAVELYMKAIKLSSNENERSRLKLRCKEVLARAEEIKLLESWIPQNIPPSQPQTKALKIPVSERTPTTREEIILLEGSKLHGFVFPPWKAEPGPEVFEKSGDDDVFEYVNISSQADIRADPV